MLSLDLFNFPHLFIYFLCSASMFSTTLSSSSLICSSMLSTVDSSLFFISVIVFFICVWFLFILSNGILEFLNFMPVHPLLRALIVFRVITLNSIIGGLPPSTSLCSSSGVLSFSFFVAYSSVASFYLICCFYVCVSSTLVAFYNLGEVISCERSSLVRSHLLWEVISCEKRPVCPSSALPRPPEPSATENTPYMGCLGPSVVVNWLLWVVW